MAKDPDHRYQSAGEMIHDLDRWLQGDAPLHHPTPFRRRALLGELHSKASRTARAHSRISGWEASG